MESIRTLGHGTLDVETFSALVQGAGIVLVVDVRRFPGSRRHPHFKRAAVEAWLADRGIGYRWLAGLGGRREPAADSPNTGLRNAQFRAYADHMATRAFADGIAELTGLAAEARVAVMCAEAVWWRRHRQLVADHLVLVEGLTVEHLFHDGRVAEHVPSPQARRVDDHVSYPPAGG